MGLVQHVASDLGRHEREPYRIANDYWRIMANDYWRIRTAGTLSPLGVAWRRPSAVRRRMGRSAASVPHDNAPAP
jgi:hypothetical protein